MVWSVVAGAGKVPSGGFTIPRRDRTLPRMRCEGSAKAPPLTAEQQAEMEKAMQNPEVQQRMQAMEAAMKNPAVQQQMAEAQAAMANPALQQRMKELRDDPEFKDMFRDIEAGGMPALMKYFNDPKVLSKLGSKLEGVPMNQTPATPAEPEINDLLDASRYGDVEALEDFLAVGKDINMQDAEGRTPLHYAAAHDHTRIAQILVDKEADLEKADSKNNTALHYACGYGRLDVVDILLRGGANVYAENQNGKKPIDLAMLNQQNPVLADQEILELLNP